MNAKQAKAIALKLYLRDMHLISGHWGEWERGTFSSKELDKIRTQMIRIEVRFMKAIYKSLRKLGESK